MKAEGELKGGITNNLNLGLVYKPSFWGNFKILRLGFELLMFYYVQPMSVFLY